MIRREVVSVESIAPLGLNLSPRRGNRTPEELRGQSSVECVLALRSDSRRLEEVMRRFEILTADHYGSSAALAIRTMLWGPEDGGALLEEAAVAATYGCFNSVDGVRLDLTLEAFADRERSPIRAQFQGKSVSEISALAHELAQEELPAILREPSRYRELWEEGLARVQAHLRDFSRGRVEFVLEDDDIDFTAVEVRGPLDRRALRTVCENSRTLVSYAVAGGWCHEFTYEIESWMDVDIIETLPRHDLAVLARQLNDLESGSALRWGWDRNFDVPTCGMRAGLEGGEPSTLTPAQVSQIVHHHFWNADGVAIPPSRRLRNS